MTIQEALTDFLIEQQIRGNTQKTVQYYSLSVGLYARFAGSDTPLQEINLNSLRAYYLHLQGEISAVPPFRHIFGLCVLS